MINIYDKLVPMHVTNLVYDTIRKFPFTLGWQDAVDIHLQGKLNMHCRLDEKTARSFGIMELAENHPDISYLLVGYKLFTAVVNLTFPGQDHYSHTHRKNQRILLYYANPKWDRDYGGDTIFYDVDGVDKVVTYKSGRLVLFDGHHDHSIRSQSFNSLNHRFTIAFVYQLEDDEIAE